MNGYIASKGVIVGEIHGYTGQPLPIGQTFIPAGIPGVGIGKPAPDVKAIRLAALAARRYQAETSGIIVGAVRYHTDRDSQSMMTSTIRMLEEREMRGEPTNTAWKTMNGSFVPVNLDGLIEIALIIGKHVEACFTREAELAQQIMSASNPNTVNIDVGWPGG